MQKLVWAAESHDEEGTLTKVFDEEGPTGIAREILWVWKNDSKVTSEGTTKDPGTSGLAQNLKIVSFVGKDKK